LSQKTKSTCSTKQAFLQNKRACFEKNFVKKILSYFVGKKDDILALAALLGFSFLANFWTPFVTEPDNVYHIAVASIYKARGIFFTNFSWDTFSVFAKYHSDLWYGFHLLLVPFLSGDNYALAIHSAGAFLTFSLCACCYFIFRELKIPWPVFWVFFFFLSTFQIFVRMTDPRPQIVIAALSALLFYFLAWRRNRPAMFVISVLLTFIDISMLWLPICFFFLDWLSRDFPPIVRREWKILANGLTSTLADIGCILAGILFGIFLRPNPIAGLRLFYYQIFYDFWQKFHGVPLPWGGEMYPLRGAGILLVSGLVIIFLVSFCFWILADKPGKITPRQTRFLNSGFTVAFFFLALSFLSANRAFDFFALPGVFVIALIYNLYKETLSIPKKNLHYAFFVLLEVMFVISIQVGVGYLNLGVNDYAGEAAFLQKNSAPGDIVANLFFDDYSGLFLLDKTNRYLNHSDPIFQYADNPTVGKEFICAMNRVTGTDKSAGMKKYCQNEPVAADTLARIVSDDFDARYVFVASNEIGYTALCQYFSKTAGSKMVYQNIHGAIFELRK